MDFYCLEIFMEEHVLTTQIAARAMNSVPYVFVDLQLGTEACPVVS